MGALFEFLVPFALLPLWPRLVVGAVLVVAGVLLIRASMRAIDDAGTTYDPYAPSTALVTVGIYRYTRNPGYLGLAVIVVGIAIVFDSVWIVLADGLAILVTTRFVIQLEEEKLSRCFGQPYDDYVARVRRWI